jgi:hypothetical protein
MVPKRRWKSSVVGNGTDRIIGPVTGGIFPVVQQGRQSWESTLKHRTTPMPHSDKKSLSERDICTKFIAPAVARAGWDIQLQVREEVSFTKGRIIVKGKTVSRGSAKRADYILSSPRTRPFTRGSWRRGGERSVDSRSVCSRERAFRRTCGRTGAHERGGN